MSKRLLSLVTIGAALTVLGAACSPKATINTGNTSVTVNVPVNSIINAANSSSTGDFSTSTNTAAQLKTVTISPTGVSPKTLTVSAGTPVTFVNTDTIAHQIASNPHPNHTDLPGFDNVNSATTYTFTFTKKGTFGYHDHDDPNNTASQGTIIVQ